MPLPSGRPDVAKVLRKLSEVYRRVGYVQLLPCWAFADGAPATNEQILRLLRDLYDRVGHITWQTINSQSGMPSAHVYAKRFGSLTQTFELAGVPHTRTQAQQSAYRRSIDRGTAALRSPQPETAGGHVVSRFSDEVLFCELRRMAARDGHVSARSIDAEPGLPSPASFHYRFGSLLKACELAGLDSDRDELRRAGRARQMLRPE